MELEKQRNLEDVLKTKKRLDDFQSGGEEKNAEEKLCALKAKRDQLTAEIKTLRTNCEMCERNASVLRSIELKKDAAESELSALNNIKDDIEVDLRQLLDEDASSDLERLCDRVGSQLQLKQELYKSAQEKLMNLTADYKADERKLQDLKMEHENSKNLIHTKRSKLDSEYLPLIREFCENNDAILNKTWSEKCINIVQEKLNDKQDIYHVKNAMMQVMEKAAQKARQEHKCFLCKRSFDYNEETNFLKMLNEVNKDDSLEIVISDLKAKVKCIEQYHFSLVNDILPKEESMEEKKCCMIV